MQLSVRQRVRASGLPAYVVRPHYYFFVLATFLLEEVINARLGIALAVPIVFVMLMIVEIGTLLRNGVPMGSSKVVGLLFVIATYQFISLFASPTDCTVDAKFLTTLVMLGVMTWAFWWLRPELSVFSDAGSKWLLGLIAVSMVLSLAGLDVMTILGSKPNVPAGFYSEPSHLALHLVPLLAYRMLIDFFDRVSWLSLAAVLIVAPSSTLTLGLLGIIVIKLGMNLRSKVPAIVLGMLMLGVLVVLAAAGNENPFLNRISGILNSQSGDIVHLSSAVWLNGWSQAYEHFLATNGLGVGVNRMGCGHLEFAGYLSTDLSFIGDGTVLNSNDGSFMFSKIVSEFGIFGLLACLYISARAIKSLFSPRMLSTQSGSEINHDFVLICRAAAGLTLIIYMYVRGMSYFAFPVMLAFCVLIRTPVHVRTPRKTSTLRLH